MCVLENPSDITGLSSEVRKCCPCCLLVSDRLPRFLLF